MSNAIRMIHFADVHIGMENYGKIDPSTGTSTRVRDFLDRLDEVVDYAIDHQADLAVFAGDAFKDRNPEQTQQREFAQRIKRLADHMPTLLLVGNHDMPGMAVKANSLDIFRALDVPDVIVGYKDEAQVVQTKNGPVFLAWMPYPMRNRLMAWTKYQGKSIEELNQGLRSEVSSRIRSLAEQANQQDMPRVLAGHFTVEAASYGSERSVMLGSDLPILRSTVADQAWDYVALGHLHKHQDVNEGEYPSVVYSGSLERIDFGEQKEPKGFVWVELQRGSTEWTFKPVKARSFHTLNLDIRKADDPMGLILSALEDESFDESVVRVAITMNSEQSVALRERDIEAALETAQSVSIVRDIEVEARARLSEFSPETMSPLELLEQYFESRSIDPEHRIVLLARAEEIFDGAV